MSKVEFFSISGIATAAHTPETKKIWHSFEKNKSLRGRQAILRYAEDLGFEHSDDNPSIEEAFHYLLGKFPPMPGIKSFILRQAIIHYS